MRPSPSVRSEATRGRAAYCEFMGDDGGPSPGAAPSVLTLNSLFGLRLDERASATGPWSATPTASFTLGGRDDTGGTRVLEGRDDDGAETGRGVMEGRDEGDTSGEAVGSVADVSTRMRSLLSRAGNAGGTLAAAWSVLADVERRLDGRDDAVVVAAAALVVVAVAATTAAATTTTGAGCSRELGGRELVGVV